MQKHILIIGPAESGKTKLANEIAADYSFAKNEVCFLNMRQKRTIPNFFFDECTKETKLVIIDEIKSIDQLQNFYYITAGVKVDKPAQSSFTIYPRLILVSESITESDIPSDASFNRRFDVIKLTN